MRKNIGGAADWRAMLTDIREVHRSKRMSPGRGGCDACGRYNHTPSGSKFLYVYQAIGEHGRVNYIAGQYCSDACMTAATKTGGS